MPKYILGHFGKGETKHFGGVPKSMLSDTVQIKKTVEIIDGIAM
jgi:hypothetical protein